MARLKDKVQNALDEARLLILGAQVLLGFEYRSVFESGFERLPEHSRYLKLVSLTLLLVVLALLVWPGAYHRVVSRGMDSEDVHRFTSRVMEVALLPFSIALGLDLFVASERVLGTTAGIVVGIFTSALALACWYGVEAFERGRHKEKGTMNDDVDVRKPRTKLKDKIQHVLTETRVVLPGAQALLGFQLVTILMDGFEKLETAAKYVHLVSLCLITVSIIILMTQAAYHRIVEKGEETEHFHRLAGLTLLSALVPLAAAVCGDFFVVTWAVTGSVSVAFACGGFMLVLFYGLWFGLPSYWRALNVDRTRAGGVRRAEERS